MSANLSTVGCNLTNSCKKKTRLVLMYNVIPKKGMPVKISLRFAFSLTAREM